MLLLLCPCQLRFGRKLKSKLRSKISVKVSCDLYVGIYLILKGGGYSCAHSMIVTVGLLERTTDLIICLVVFWLFLSFSLSFFNFF